MRILFAGGGTGGHLYPGLAIARALRRLDSAVDPFFVGARRGIERRVLPVSEFPHELLDLHPLYRSRPWENVRTVAGALSAWRGMNRITATAPPLCVVGTGGYASGIALGYATVHRIPIVIQEQNSFPGLTTRFFSRFARQVHNGFPEAARYLAPGRRTEMLDSGNPIEPPPDRRPEKATARARWGFPPVGGAVMLVYGGSQGARAINEAVAAWIAGGLPDEVYVIWATGEMTHGDFAGLGSERVKVTPYITSIADAYAATDFALSRAGAMATAELCAWGIPAILVPLPTAAADHQTANARALAAAGVAEMIPQSELSQQRLAQVVGHFVRDPGALAAHSAAALNRARPHAAADIARDILRLVRNAAGQP